MEVSPQQAYYLEEGSCQGVLKGEASLYY